MADREILGFGPRSAEVLEALARAIYAPDAA
jgi:iron complex transport system substrate-binding protein